MNELELKLERLKNSCHYILPIDSETRLAEIEKSKKEREKEIVFNNKNKTINKPPTLKVAKINKEEEMASIKLKEKTKENNLDNKNNLNNKIEEDEDYIEDEDFDEIESNLIKENKKEKERPKPIINENKHFIDVNIEKSQQKEKVKLNNALNKKESLNPIPKMQTKITVKNKQLSSVNNIEDLNVNAEDNVKVVTPTEKSNLKKSIPKATKPLNKVSKPNVKPKSIEKNDKIKNRKVKFNQNLLEIAKEKNRKQNQKLNNYKSLDDIVDDSKVNAFNVFNKPLTATTKKQIINKNNVKKSSSIKITPLKDKNIKEVYYDSMKDSFNIKDTEIEKKKNAIRLKQQVKANENAYANFREDESIKELKQNKNNSLMKSFKPKRKK